MHVGWIGGVESSSPSLIKAAHEAGHSLEVHTGHLRGKRGSDGLEGIITRSDLVVIVVDVNSHGAVLMARDLAKKCGRPAVIVRRPSVSALKRVMSEYQTHH